MGLRSSISPKLLSLQIRKHKNGLSTFPSLEGWETHFTLEVVGKGYYEFRLGLDVSLVPVIFIKGLIATFSMAGVPVSRPIRPRSINRDDGYHNMADYDVLAQCTVETT